MKRDKTTAKTQIYNFSRYIWKTIFSMRLPEHVSTLQRRGQQLEMDASYFVSKDRPRISCLLCNIFRPLTNLTASAARKHTRQLRATETKRKKEKALHGQRKNGFAGEDSPQSGHTMDETPVFYSLGDQLAHLDEVLESKILQAKKAEGCV